MTLSSCFGNEVRLLGYVCKQHSFALDAGYKAKGDAKLLHREGTARGLLVKVLELQSASEDSQGVDEITSSSRVREYLRNGRVEHIHQLLDRPYAIILPLDSIVDSHGGGKSSLSQSCWSFWRDLAMTEVPEDGVYDAVVCADSSSGVLSAGTLTVRSKQECFVELEQPVEILADTARYLRIELLRRL